MAEMTEPSSWEKGREQFHKVLADPQGQAIVIVGPERSGKSTLLRDMVMSGETGGRFHFDGEIHRVGPGDRPNDVLVAIGKWPSGVVTHLDARAILERLSRSVEEFGDLHRRVVGIDASPKQPEAFKQRWLEIILQLPDKVKFIFTQRPDGILATNEQFMALPNVVRIDIAPPPAPDEDSNISESEHPKERKLTKEPNQSDTFEKRYELLAPTSKMIVNDAAKLAIQWPEIGGLTTSCLLFAFLDRGKSKAKRFNTAKFFSDRISERVSSNAIAERRINYFEHTESSARLWEGVHTESCGKVAIFIIDILGLATGFAIRTTRSEKIHVRHLLAAMLLYRFPKYVTGSRKTINDLGLTVEWILEGFTEHLRRFKSDDQEEWRRILAGVTQEQAVEEETNTEKLSAATDSAESVSSPERISDVVGNVATIQIEGIGEKDRLGRDKLVKTLAEMFAQTECDNGFTMALLGDWGQGKSTVMGLLEKELNRKHKGRFEFAKYNAWEYENAENIAAGMAQEVVSGIIDRTRFWERQKLRFHFALLEYGKDMCRVALYVVIAVLLLWVASALGGQSKLKDYGVTMGWGGLLVFVFVNIAKIIEHPMSIKLEMYLSLPNYRKHLGFVPVLRRHINTLCSLRLRQAGMRLKRRWLAKLWKSASRLASSRGKVLFGFRLLGKLGKKVLKRWWLRVKAKPVSIKQLVLFVDDLDRCNVDHIVKVLDAIRLVMTIPNVIVMIGIDHRIAFKAIGKHYEELADGDDTRGAGEIARDYLGKIIQLPLRLRAASHDELEKYVFEGLFDEKTLVDDSKHAEELGRKDSAKKTLEVSVSEEISVSEMTAVEQETDKATTGATAGPEATEEEISEAIKDTKTERNVFYELAGRFDFSNPRQLLRLHNSFRFLKGYGRARGEGHDTLDMLTMLFWQEFLHNWPMKIRGSCMAELIGETNGEGVEPTVKKVLDRVRDDIGKLFDGGNYAQLAEFVRIVVLPHSEEGIFDTKEEVDEWLKKGVTQG